MPKRNVSDTERAAILSRAGAYVELQLATMEKYGGAPILSVEQYEALVLKCAKPALEIARWQAPQDSNS